MYSYPPSGTSPLVLAWTLIVDNYVIPRLRWFHSLEPLPQRRRRHLSRFPMASWGLRKVHRTSQVNHPQVIRPLMPASLFRPLTNPIRLLLISCLLSNRSTVSADHPATAHSVFGLNRLTAETVLSNVDMAMPHVDALDPNI